MLLHERANVFNVRIGKLKEDFFKANKRLVGHIPVPGLYAYAIVPMKGEVFSEVIDYDCFGKVSPEQTEVFYVAGFGHLAMLSVKSVNNIIL